MEQQLPLGELLRRHREAAGYSQEALAEHAGLSANAISALERGERKRPFPDTIRRLAEALNLTAAERTELTAAAFRSRGDAPPTPVPDPLMSRVRHELPGELTPLIGRDHETEAVRHLLTQPGQRLLTLTGSGGVGKTRLALHVARAMSKQYADGAGWVELAALIDPALVLPTIARVLGGPEAPNADPGETLRANLHGRRLLLVLDNFEHVLAAATEIATLLIDCPDLIILATSRAPLGIRGEQEYTVPPLELPAADLGRELADLAGIPAVQLFIWRVRQKDPSFSLSQENAAVVAAICRRLEGVPLALELAASWVKLLGPAELLARLNQSLPLLAGGSRDLPPRQQTMEAAIGWSYNLLAPHDQALFRRLAVFAGGWTLEAADAIVNVTGNLALDILQGMAALADHSLVRQMERQGTTPRFTMLEMVREFGHKQLAATGESALVQRAHIAWYLALVEEADANLTGPDQKTWLERLETEHDNLRAAISAALAAGDEAALSMTSAIWRFWEVHGNFSEGRACLERALTEGMSTTPLLRAKVLRGAGALARDQGDFAQATSYDTEALRLFRQLNDQPGVASMLTNLGNIALDQTEFERAIAQYQQALALYQELHDQQHTALVLNNLGLATTYLGELDTAARHYEESLTLSRALGGQLLTAMTLDNQGQLAYLQGDFRQAMTLHEASLAIRRELGYRQGMATSLTGLAVVALAMGEVAWAVDSAWESLELFQALGDRAGVVENLACLARAAGRSHPALAVRLLGAAAAQRTRLGLAVPATERARCEQDLAALREILGGDVFAAAWAAGQNLTVDQAIALAATLVAAAKE